MTGFKDRLPQLGRRSGLGIGAAVLLALGAAGGAGAVSLTRPSVQMAPMVNTPIAKLAASSGIVTVKGRIAEVYGDRFVLQDQTGRTMIDAGRETGASPVVGQTVTVQGRFEEGQLHAAYLVGPDGKVSVMGPAGGPRPDGPPPPPGGPRDRPEPAPPPAPAGCGVAAPQPGTAPGAPPLPSRRPLRLRRPRR
ncbi:hypothetical protein [Sphingomonas hengshuiensis]|uniref:hypothetical protein n=1 Tax=Sphingomonas hengshuiensis TaxID=1609977 RepID=UPI000697A804|nr:hypothetical protein [Sphingomonas hengshuiensis]